MGNTTFSRPLSIVRKNYLLCLVCVIISPFSVTIENDKIIVYLPKRVADQTFVDTLNALGPFELAFRIGSRSHRSASSCCLPPLCVFHSLNHSPQWFSFPFRSDRIWPRISRFGRWIPSVSKCDRPTCRCFRTLRSIRLQNCYRGHASSCGEGSSSKCKYYSFIINTTSICL